MRVKVGVVDAVVTVGVVAEVGQEVASARDTVGTVVEIIMSYNVLVLFSRKRKREISRTHMTMKAPSSQKFISAGYIRPDLPLH
jgi:hypothetical protein